MAVEADRLSEAALTVELWGRVIHGFDMTNRRIHAPLREEFDLSEAEAQVLLYLYRQPECSAPMAALARAAAFSSGGFTKLADKMIRRGLVCRTAAEGDRRVTLLEFTDAGRELAGRITERTAELTRDHVVAVLGQERAGELARVMTTLYRANTPPGSEDPALIIERPWP